MTLKYSPKVDILNAELLEERKWSKSARDFLSFLQPDDSFRARTTPKCTTIFLELQLQSQRAPSTQLHGSMGQPRRLNALLRARIRIAIPASNARRYSEFVKAATNASNKSQIYISRSLDPYLNLSIEHYLLQKTPENSTVLFLYTNRECIVIGRNQNPWVETNLPWFRNNSVKCDLVRRRSGGGTVFHDEGNVNYSVICPTSDFHRDKHAEMVVQALHKLGVDKAMVNERHDIVLDGGDRSIKPLKVSGSAYKLTRLRSLHHGTCLLDSSNIENISNVLFSPARPFIKARGVDSVKSAVTNVHRSNESFEEAVVSEFRKLYNGGQPMTVHDSLEKVPEIAKGFEELKVCVHDIQSMQILSRNSRRNGYMDKLRLSRSPPMK